MNELKMVINKVAISESNGMFSLTDLHKASGSSDRKRPSRWLRLERSKGLISELNNDLSAVIKSDKKAGTFGCPEVVIAYAMYINPIFEVAVIREYLKQSKKILRMADAHGKVEWQQNRAIGKLTRYTHTDSIQIFLKYAGNQGSKNYPAHGYSMITAMINKALDIDDRETAAKQQLHLIATAEHICVNALMAGMEEELAYMVIYQDARNKVIDFAEMAKPLEVA